MSLGSRMFSSGSQVLYFGLHPFHLTRYCKNNFFQFKTFGDILHETDLKSWKLVDLKLSHLFSATLQSFLCQPLKSEQMN